MQRLVCHGYRSACDLHVLDISGLECASLPALLTKSLLLFFDRFRSHTALLDILFS